ncbi:PQQ-binding-like beta-propeller repeat protein [Roseivirga sp. BDSF3-8]|uniref:outer membrane protein assembly factor BamB family protein n=1 Tax=Roseivirga sp. BDSF3-8 TaxID=3241598 RepID=UPI0035321D5B
MKYIKINELENIKLQPVLASDKMLALDLEDQVHIYDIESLKQLESKHFGGKSNIEVIDNEVYLYLNDSLERINLKTLDLEKKWKKEFGQIAYVDKEYVAEQLCDRKSKKLRLAMFECSPSRLIWEREFTGHRFARNFVKGLFLTDINFTYLIKLNLETGEELWSYSLPEEEKVEGNVYVYENILVIPSKAGQTPFDKTYLQGINMNTGELLWRRESNIYLYQNNRTGLLYAFGGEVYIVINPKNGETLVKEEFKGIKEANKLLIVSNMCRMCGNGLYFISDYVENYYDCQFGKINTDSHEIEFIQKLDVAEGVKADPPIYYNGRIYIKDSLNTLHIYEQVG